MAAGFVEARNMELAVREEMAVRRIASTLVALAALAGRAGALPFPLAWLVLAILSAAECVARGFVAEATGSRLRFDAPPERGPADAAWLALRFAALAAALGALLRLACRFHCRNNSHVEPARLGPRAVPRLTAPAGGRQEVLDTS